ncbi:hypothetical protein BDN72DRAFT_832367 [Pluteus cervinus]|uniref:Uncharacterized protein n=1 Tax=Pluteus cervinus TaxID=181527 RepID=A0ACD3BAI2_9AGAR|nr:hypothetical protein BDN72DRAFT_832367 [Pluteus cervinus]
MALPNHGSVIVSGVAVCSNPRSNGRAITLDANFYVDDDHSTPHTTYLTYWNKDDQTFDPVGIYYVTTTLTRITDTLPNKSKELKEVDYMAAGDIRKISAAGADAFVEEAPMMSISGAIIEIDETAGWFDLNPSQYASSLKDSKNKPTCPVRCVIQESKRWGDKGRPKMAPGYFVMVTGEMGRAVRDNEGKVLRFEIEVTDISSLGRSVVPPPTTSAGTPANKAFSYGNKPGKKRRLGE